MGVIVKAALADQLVDILRERIIGGLLPTGEPIRQDALATEFGISKIPLREALARLEQDGLVVSQLNRGFFVRPMSAEEAYDVFDLRLRLEPDAVAAAALRLTAGAVEQAGRVLQALDAAATGHDPGAGRMNRAFHMALLRPCGRPVTLQTLERLQAIAERYVVCHLAPQGRVERASAEHAALFQAWAAGDASRARELTTRHITATLDDLRTELDRALPLSA